MGMIKHIFVIYLLFFNIFIKKSVAVAYYLFTKKQLVKLI